MPSVRQDKYGSYLIDYRENGKRIRRAFGFGQEGKLLAQRALSEIILAYK